MPEKEVIFEGKTKFDGIFNFKDFYRFAYDWLGDEAQLILMENKYTEKAKGESKDVDVAWDGFRKFTDYFKFDASIKFRILGLTDVEITDENGKKIKTNKGSIEIKVKGTLVRDWQGKFESNGFQKMLRAIYEKFFIQPRVDQLEEKAFDDLTEFMEQAKAFFATEGRRIDIFQP